MRDSSAWISTSPRSIFRFSERGGVSAVATALVARPEADVWAAAGVSAVSSVVAGRPVSALVCGPGAQFLALENEADVLKLLHRLPADKVGRLLDAQMDEAAEGRREIRAVLDAYYGGRVRQLLPLLDPDRSNRTSRRLSRADRAFWRHHSAEKMLEIGRAHV